MTVQPTALHWDQVCAWRLGQHFLAERAPARDLLRIISQLGGIQAQLMPAAQLALLARSSGLTPSAVEDALWQERSLVKTWVMRGTLHLITAADLPLYTAARGYLEPRRPPSYYRYHGVTPEELDAIIAGVPAVLGSQPLTREQLASAVAERSGKPNLRDVLLSGWGSLLKPSAFRGDLCFGPNQGQNVTFVHPQQWIGAWQPLDAETAMQQIARRYLHAYGPANAQDFARWWGIDAAQGKKVFRLLEAEIQPVDVAGWQAWLLAEDIEPLRAAAADSVVRLLPQFDCYTLGTPRDVAEILPAQEKNKIYRPQGWVSAVVVVNGRITGTWEQDKAPGSSAIRMEFFPQEAFHQADFLPPADVLQSALAEEEQRLRDFIS